MLPLDLCYTLPSQKTHLKTKRKGNFQVNQTFISIFVGGEVVPVHKQRGHAQVMESFHVQAEQVPLSCFISSTHSSRSPTGKRCPPRGSSACPASSWSATPPTRPRRCAGWGHTLQAKRGQNYITRQNKVKVLLIKAFFPPKAITHNPSPLQTYTS